MKKIFFAITFSFMLVLTSCGSDDYSALETEISNLKDETAALQLQVDTLETKDESNQTAISDLLLDVAALKEEIDLIGDFSSLEIEITDLQSKLTALEEELSLVDDFSSLELEIIDFQSDLTALLLQIDLLISEDETNQATINSLLLEIASLEAEISLFEDFKEYISPVFANIPGNIVIEYGTVYDLSNIGITASDNVDGDVSADITVDVTSTSALSIGNYPVTYSITDSDGNTNSITVNLEVEVTNTNYSYILINDRTEIQLTGFKNYNSAFVNIPASIGGLTVTEIAGDAFRYEGITTLTLPDTLESIGNSAFYDNSIEVIDIPESVFSIGDFAFGSNSLTNIMIKDGCAHVGVSAFRDNNIASVVIGSVPMDIGDNAFTGNVITSVYIFGNNSRFDSVWEDIGLPTELIGVQ